MVLIEDFSDCDHEIDIRLKVSQTEVKGEQMRVHELELIVNVI